MIQRIRYVEGKLLRYGITTGTCATAAASAAAEFLLSGKCPLCVKLMVPDGIEVEIEIVESALGEGFARASVIKDAGDDPDVTHGMKICAEVSFVDEGSSSETRIPQVLIDGGEGVGRVTRPGLDRPVGEAAINTTPRRMISESVLEICRQKGYHGDLSVMISIPGGAEVAQRTFNPRLGIVGGLSVIGTGGIVEPMSNAAMIDTVRLELRQLRQTGVDSVFLTPGKYGSDFASEVLGLDTGQHVTCSNFIADAISAACEEGFTKILLVGHSGKLVKLGIGQGNTHSSSGDGRMECLLACALKGGADLPLMRQIMDSVSTDAALALMRQDTSFEAARAELGQRINDCLQRRVPATVEIAYVCFDHSEGQSRVLVQSPNASEMMELWRLK